MNSRRSRSFSAPALRISSGSYTRARSRQTAVDYEQGKDRIAHWIGAWSSEEVCSMLQSLVTRCPLTQLEYLWTVLESVPHRDFQLSAQRKLPGSGGMFRSFSTPLSRELRTRLSRSRKAENKCLYRAKSTVIHEELLQPPSSSQASRSETHLVWRTPPPEAMPQCKLPGLRPSVSATPLPHPPQAPPNGSRACSTLAASRLISGRGTTATSCRQGRSGTCSHSTERSRTLSTPHTRILSPMRRHMQSPPGLPSALERDTPTPITPLPQRIFHPSSPLHQLASGITPDLGLPRLELPPEVLRFLSWFSGLAEGWQRQEVLQLVVWNLDQRELYYLAALLMSRQTRDFVSELTEALALRVLVYVPSRDLLRNCCTVSQAWNARCSSERLWEVKCRRGRLGFPLYGVLSWKSLYRDDLRLKRNWRRGRCVVRELRGHSDKVLCAKIRDGILATGGSDCTIRLWNLETGERLGALSGHQKSVWCLCFYGKNLLISGANDCSIKIWNIRTKSCERTLNGHSGPVWAIQQKKEVLISGSHDKTAAIWDVRHCSLVRRLQGHRGVVFAVDLDHTSSVAFTGAGDKTIAQWEVATGLCLRVIQASRTHPVISLQWMHGYIASSAGGVATLWEARSGEALAEFRGHEDRIESVQLKVRDSETRRGVLLTAARDKTIKYWDISSGRCLHTLSGHEDKVSCATSDDVHIVSVSDDGCIKIWDFHPHRVNYNS